MNSTPTTEVIASTARRLLGLPGAALLLALIGLLALAALLTLGSDGDPAQADDGSGAISLLYVDMDTTGNSIDAPIDSDADTVADTEATSLGSVEDCAAITGTGTLDIDIAIADWPGGGEQLVGYDIVLNYDPDVVQVVAANTGGSPLSALISADPQSGSIANIGDGTFPDTDGTFVMSVMDIGGPVSGDEDVDGEETSPGFLARITLQGVGPGQSTLSLTTPGALILTEESLGSYVPVDQVNNGFVSVDQSCVPGSQPGPTPPPLPSPACADGPDSDADGFSNCIETFVGTDPFLSCALTAGANDEDPDAWPVDANDNQVVNILDFAILVLPPQPEYDVRSDLNTDGATDLLDALPLKTHFLSTCTPPLVIVVDSTGDGADSNPGNGVCDDGAGNCTLRAAIQETNAYAGTDVIEFNIAGAGPHTISPASALPTITEPVIIDGTSEPDFEGTPIVVLDGTSVATDGLLITAGGSTVKGLVINNFGDNGIELWGGSGNTIQGNYLGTDVSGTTALPNHNGVYIRATPGNTIGGTTAESRNVISGNNYSGISMMYGGAGGNQVQGNYIGTDASGTADLGNLEYGIYIDDVPNNTIGGTAAGARNVISGNDFDGIYIVLSGATGNTVEGNYIGTNAAGDSDLGNTLDGVRIDGAPSNTIGGTEAGEGNVISGNDSRGVRIVGSDSTGNQVQGNYIGIDATGTVDLGNGVRGVVVNTGASNNVIGGTTSGAGNVISGNDSDGVIIRDTGTTGNEVLGNRIGTDVTGTADVGNTENGVLIRLGATGNVVGGAASGARNVISGNGNHGVVMIDAGTTGNQVLGNYIGTDVTGTANLANTQSGVVIWGDASDNTVGGTASQQGNTISFNGGDGVCVEDDTSAGNSIRGNSIHSNTLLGIDLVPSGQDCTTGTVTPNDPGDGDTGPNDLMNFPIITSAVYDGANTTISGTIDTGDASPVIDVYVNEAKDGDRNSEGQIYLGSDTASSGTWSLVVPGTTPYDIYTATATDSGDNTSEFSSKAFDPWADTVVDFVQGANGWEEFNDATAALGPPDMSYDPVGGFVSLGEAQVEDTGYLIVAFDQPIVNEPGPDIVIYGDPALEDYIEVQLSTDGEAYSPVPGGPFPEHLALIDIEAAGLGSASYVRIDDDNAGVFNGAEIDAVGPPDNDNDGVAYASDNCPDDHNPLQIDHDGDGIGDVCDSAVRNRYSAETGSSIIMEFTTAPGQSIPVESRAFHEWDYEPGDGIDIGAIVGSIDLGLTALGADGTCSYQAYYPGITLLNASIDNSPGNLIDTGGLRGDTNANGIPDGAEKYPDFLNTILDPERRANVDDDGDGVADEDLPDGVDDDEDGLFDEDGIGPLTVPHARYIGEYGTSDFVQVLVFEESPNELYRFQLLFDDPTLTPPLSIPACSPIEIRATVLDTSEDNLATVPDESGDTVLNTPAAGTKSFHFQTVDPPDADGDGVPNVLDNCATDYNPAQDDADSDAIGDVCEPVSGPCAGTAALDCDSDGQYNAYDNCPTDDNAGQEEQEIRTPRPFGLPPYNDHIGDVCDPNPTLVDDTTIAVGEYSDPICVTDTDADADGWCEADDPNDDDASVTPEDDSVAPGSCNNGVDDDGDTDVDFNDSACADADGDTVPDNVDNCDEAANPLQLDADGDTQGDACEDAHIVTLQTVAYQDGANSELRGRLVEPAPKPLRRNDGIVILADPDWGITAGSGVDNGAIRGALATMVTASIDPTPTCNNVLPMNFTLMDASTDIGNTIDTDAFLTSLVADGNANELPDGVDKFPSFLLALPATSTRTDDDGDGVRDEDPTDDVDNDLDGLTDEDPYNPATPLARSFGHINSRGANHVVNLLTYSPGALPAFDATQGYITLLVINNPTAVTYAGDITAFCSPQDARLFLYGASLDNPLTGVTEGTSALLTNASNNNVTEKFFTRVTSQRDLEGDGIENSLDACFDNADNDGDTIPDQNDPSPWNPRLVSPPGDPDGDGLPTGCDPYPNDPSPPGSGPDEDGDHIPNSADNCPNDANPYQTDSDVDGIGDVCDSEPAVAQGSAQTVSNGMPQCPSPGIDVDKDGYCTDLDPKDDPSLVDDLPCPGVASIDCLPENSAYDPGTCKDGEDNDGDKDSGLPGAGIDMGGVAGYPRDSGCGDVDMDGILNEDDNCRDTPNGGQEDSDTDTGAEHIGSQPFLRSELDDPIGPPSDVLGQPFLRSDNWGGDACDPDDDNDGLPDGSEALISTDPICISTSVAPRLDSDCDDDLLGDLVEYRYSALCLADPNCSNPTNACLNPTNADVAPANGQLDYKDNYDADTLFNYGEAVIGTDPCTDSGSVLTLNTDSDTVEVPPDPPISFADGLELYVRTDFECACDNDSDLSDWPPDFNSDHYVNILDVGAVLPPMFGAGLEGGFPFSRRADLAPDGFINILDVGVVLPPTFGKSCTPP